MENDSAISMWGDYLNQHLEDVFHEAPKTMHFGHTEEQANELVNLIKKGEKTAVSYSLLGLQFREEKLPKIGDFIVVTDWDGTAQCIVETMKVRLKPFFSITQEFASQEAEGDKSLEQWKKTHWEHYTNELAAYERLPRESMIIVCQEFEKIYER